MAPPVVTVFARHRSTCPHFSKGEFYRGCRCPKFLRYSFQGKQHRISAKTGTWSVAEDRRGELQQQLDGGKQPTPVIVTVDNTIEDAVQTVLTAKTTEGVGHARLRKLKQQLGVFRQFMESRSKFFPSQITTDDLVAYRATWDSWESGLTKQKAQQNLREFLRACSRKNLPDLLRVLKPIKLSKTDVKRLAPQPFTEVELKHLIAQIPKTFSDEVIVRRVRAFIHGAVATGLAIVDMCLLERESIAGGWLRINRQKTGKAVMQQLDSDLVEELLSVAHNRYIFWDGRGELTTITGYWHDDYLRPLMKDAGVWIKGNVAHRFRDTAVDFWLSEGASMTEVAAMLGDTVAVCEKHYADLASKRMESRLAKMPKRKWGKHV